MQALQLIAQNQFDLIIVSLNLKHEGRFTFFAPISVRMSGLALAPIVMVGGEEDMPRIAHGLEIGAHDYLLRPLDRNELLARVRTQIRRKRFQERLRTNYEMSLSVALTDALTGLFNRRYFDAYLQKMLQTAEVTKKPMGIVYMDIDFFKKVNDTYGHTVGDEILQGFAARVKDSLRSFDLVARLGGEEFVAILPDTTEDVAQIIAERLRRTVAEKPFPVSSPEGKLSVTPVPLGGWSFKGKELRS
jgi:two-component system cell cycle response regulator